MWYLNILEYWLLNSIHMYREDIFEEKLNSVNISILNML